MNSVRRQPGLVVLLLVCGGCAVTSRNDPPPDAATDGAVLPDGADAAPLPDGDLPDAESPQTDGGPDGCVPQSDPALCTLHSQQCGPLSTFDNCAVWRDITECGPCVGDAYCDSGTCLPYTYEWVYGNWSACSVPCGPGTRTRTATCERNDGQTVASSFCTGTPYTSEPCNDGPCVNCGLITAADPDFEVCETGPAFCAGVYTAGEGCAAFCAPVSLPCTARFGAEPGCILEPQNPWACNAVNGHDSNWCECGTR